MLKLFFSGENFLMQSKSGPKMAVLGEKGCKCEISVFQPEKGTFESCAAPSFDVFCVNVRGGVLAAVNNLVREVAHAHAQKRNPLSDLDKILHGGRYPRPNYLRKFW